MIIYGHQLSRQFEKKKKIVKRTTTYRLPIKCFPICRPHHFVRRMRIQYTFPMCRSSSRKSVCVVLVWADNKSDKCSSATVKWRYKTKKKRRKKSEIESMFELKRRNTKARKKKETKRNGRKSERQKTHIVREAYPGR